MVRFRERKMEGVNDVSILLIAKIKEITKKIYNLHTFLKFL